ncbi:MAG TPA: GntR family transcriptional regulator [Solirubrobacteraceae bacterium]|nr:GntR family transcriptional regulator [Solirubrobacteraceae bacterium]
MNKQFQTISLEGFDVAIDRDAEVPIGVQLAWALRTRIRDGRFKPSQRLPGLRDLAEAIGVNVNTVRAVYQRLEHEGLIDSQQGSGTFVASTPHKPSAVGTIAADAAREAHATGVDPREVAAALYVASDSSSRPVDEAAERRRLLRTQIAGLERTLGELEAGYPGLAPAPTQTRRGMGPTLPSVAELEEVRTQLVRRLVTLQGAIDAQTPGAGIAGMGERADARERKRTAIDKPKTPTRQSAATNKTEPVTVAKKPKRVARPRAGPRPAPAGT